LLTAHRSLGSKTSSRSAQSRLDSVRALRSVKVKVSDVYFLIALAKGDQDAAHNLDLMQTRAWFDFPLLLNDNRIAKLVFEVHEGETMLAKAFRSLEMTNSSSFPTARQIA
jgi:hypothetical protein